MSAERKEFILVGGFEDKISPALKKINKLLDDISTGGRKGKRKRKGDNPFFSVKDIEDGFKAVERGFDRIDKRIQGTGRRRLKIDTRGLRAAQEEAATLQKQLKELSRETKVGVSAAGLRAAQEEAAALQKMMGQELEPQVNTAGIRAAQEEIGLLGTMMQAAAGVELGRGFADSIQAGARSARGVVGKLASFTRTRLNEAAQDQLADIQARGSLFGGLNKADMFGKTPAGLSPREIQARNDGNYSGTKVISRVLENAMGEQITKSTNPTDIITLFQRQLTDNILPTVLRAQGVRDLTGARKADGSMDRDELERILVGSGTAEKLATLYDQMAAVTPQKHYAPTSARAYAEYLSTGKVNRQLGVFMQNPVLADSLEDKGRAAGGDPAKLLQALVEGLEIAMPKAALMEAQTTFVGAQQALTDTLFNASVGVMSFGAEVVGTGEKALAIAGGNAKDNTALVGSALDLMQRQGIATYERSIARDKKKLKELQELQKEEKDSRKRQNRANTIATIQKKIADTEANRQKDYEKIRESSKDLVINWNSPFEFLMGASGGTIQALGNFMGTMGNVWIPAVEAIFKRFHKPMVELATFIDTVAFGMEELNADASFDDRINQWSEGLGKILGKFFTILSDSVLGLESDAKNGASLIERIMDSFMKGFDSEKGTQAVNALISRLTELLMNTLFNEGKWYKGLTKLSWTLLKVFAVIAAPATIGALLTGAVTAIGIMLSTALITGTQSILSGGLLAKSAIGVPGSAAKFAPQLQATWANIVQFLKMGPKGSIRNLTPLGQLGGGATKNFIAGLKVISPKLLALGGILTAVISMAEGKGVVESISTGIGQAGGTAIGAAIGTAIAPGIGTVIGGLLGGYLGTNKTVVITISGMVSGLKIVFDELWNTSGTTLSSLGQIFNDIISVGKMLLDTLGLSTDGMNGFNVGLIAVKIALTPVVLAAQMVDDGLRGVVTGLSYLKLAAYRLQEIFYRINPGITKEQWNANRAGISGAEGDIARAAEAGKAAASRKDAWFQTPTPFFQTYKPNYGAGAASSFSGSLGDAISSEMKNKPAGSRLVIANSSETVIPAAGGYGMSDFMRTLDGGFSNVMAVQGNLSEAVKNNFNKTWESNKSSFETTYETIDKSSSQTEKAIAATSVKIINTISNTSSRVLSAISTAGMGASAGMGAAGGTGMGAGGVAAAAALGTFMKANGIYAWRQDSHGGRPTSGHSPNSLHYSGRAIDIPGSPSQHPRILALISQFNAARGLRNVELLHAGNDPGHQDHVHAAYAFGAGNPAFFSSASAADQWERAHAKGQPIISSVRARADEVGGGGVKNINITINQLPGQDSEELARVVLDKIGTALEDQVARTII
jgi:hypothetical protein